MSREHNVTDKKTAQKTLKFIAIGFTLLIQKSSFLLFCIGIENHWNLWGVRKSRTV